MAIAAIESINGSPAIVVDGKVLPPMSMTTRSTDRSYLTSLGNAGIKIYFLICNTPWLTPNAIELLTKEAKNLLSCVPDAYIILRVGMNPPMEWYAVHKDQIFTYNDGSQLPVWLASEIYYELIPGAYSLCSHIWRRDGEKALLKFMEEVEKLPFADRIIGYFPTAGGTSEWYYENSLNYPEAGLYGDFSEAFRREYGLILKEKYGTVEAMQEAWKREDASFENPIIPNLEERAFTYITREKLLLGGKNYPQNPDDGPNIGVFLNADKYAYVADFFRAWHLGTANSILHFARAIKKRNPKTLVGAFYGTFGCTEYFCSGTAAGTMRILNSGTVDFLACPGLYDNRWPGGVTAQREMQDSLRLRNMIFVSEDDTRTHKDPPSMRDSMRTYNVTDSLNVMKRDFGRNICEDIFGWWYDHTKDRFDDPDIFRLIERQQQIAHFAMEQNRVKPTQIALIYDEESIHYVSQETSQRLCDYYRTSDLHRIGAPVDYYFHNDLSHKDMPEYKLYVFINAFCLTTAEREEISACVKRDGKVALWLYGQGFVNPDKSPALANDHVEELTGFKIGRMDRPCSPRFHIVGDHPILKLADPLSQYGDIDRRVESTVWLGHPIKSEFNNPGFYIDDADATILGRYSVDELPALALKEDENWSSILCASKLLRSDMLRSIAAYAGVHIYGYDDDVLYANESFVTLHARTTGERTLHLPTVCSPWEVYERRYYGENTDTITVSAYKGQTLMFSLKGPF